VRRLAYLALFRFSALAAVPVAFHVTYATYYGGPNDEVPAAIAVDSSGNALVAGSSQAGAFVVKLNATGSAFLWSVPMPKVTAQAIGLDAAGNAYLLTSDSDDISSVTKLTAGGGAMVYSRPLGVLATGMSVDPAGNIYVVGSATQGLTTTDGAYQLAPAPGTCYSGAGVGLIPGPCPDAFVMKLNPDGSLAFATYLGGSGPDEARAVAVDSQGNVWITGDTESPNFPVTANAFEPTFHGEVDLGPLRFGDAFVSKLDPTGSRLLYSTYLGGSAPDAGFAVALDTAGSAYVAGGTQSTDFPTTPGAFQRTYGGGDALPGLYGDAFVTKFSTDGAVVYSTYVGGPQDEAATQIAVDPAGNAYIDAYPNTSTLNVNTLSELSADGSALLNAASVPGVFTLDRQSSLYFAGATQGYAFFPSPGAAQTKFGGGTYDAMLVKIDFTEAASPWITNIVNAAGLRSGTPSYYPVFDVAPGEVITIFGSGFGADTRLLFDGTSAPILYAQAGQIDAVVPFEVAEPATAITLEGSGQSFGPGSMNVFPAVPALFTVDGTGKGQAAVLNQDGSVNSTANPAPRGSVISVFLTGAGAMTPAQPDGSFGPLSSPFPIPVLGVGCSVGQVLYAGAAPGLVAGVVQVNVLLSESITPGNQVPILIYVGNYASGFGGDTTIAVR
jgi:uncharacterized protein (TIGR03437 family)